MSIEKSIDVMPEDTWTIDAKKPFVGQFRNGALIRVIHPDRIVTQNLVAESVWHLGGIRDDIAACIVTGWGYTLTPAAKPEAKPAAAPAVKEKLTTDVPVVDVVWVEDTMADGSKSLTAYSGRESAESCAKLDMERGRARIVRIRSDDEEARFLANHANERLDQHVNRLAEAHARIDALESRLAAVTEDAGYARQIAYNVSDRVDELLERVKNVESRLAAEKPADKPAARVVKAPKLPALGPMSMDRYCGWNEGWSQADARWREALVSQGITITDEGSKT